ncbi:MAG TPA: PDZ domain-containing protein [Herpetosiphon sp.]|uniref:Peptidase S1 and S6 chymotrypsin/Hap n=1 Tax=Herpetosiphon aurantiacus (strain ATCC 23779 / DSM 785 / 114-95) TaxID=316274 RepID=A9B445_HERA2|nr:trypsin-like peptidase domain-containing protein [Herpetosiphon sp.]ABX07578.1 peptidase S1 and S6 chymotrypsin/Hap [Herpetosiphon aurantiacus DSM 785]HBW49646.1 PDZ domain-containing protein [Herpetosiphon sp.]
MQLRDRLGWMLSGLLLGMLLMVSCDVVNQASTAQPSVVDAAAVPSTGPLATAAAQMPVNQAGVDAYSNVIRAVYNRGNPSVVRIDVQSEQGESLGTGFVIDKQGHIVTNNHVVGSSRSVLVNFIDGDAGIADVIGVDSDSDLAVIKMRNPDPAILIPVEFGDSAAVQVGDVVVAIGNPYGENRTATAGIISAIRGAKNEGGGSTFSIPGVLQTDAAINPGNSGGPLFNSQGQVIGVNTFILDPSGRGANIGLGFAVPINLVKLVAPAIIRDGSYTHPFFGAAVSSVDSYFAEVNNLPSKGIIITQLYNGPAAEAGLQVGDVIVSVNGEPMLEAGDLITLLELTTQPGDRMTVTVAEGNGRTRDVQVLVGARPGR